MTRATALISGILVAAAPAAATEWRQTVSPHFAVSHEKTWLPPGFLINLEKMHNRLRMDLAMFSPWMAKERLKIYLYAGQGSYLAGEFEPPAWSNGIAIFERKAVALPESADRRKLMQVLSHETTHLLFESYWQEAHKQPPSWLNEGLAMLEESEASDRPEASGWFQAMAAASPASFAPMEQFLGVTPTTDIHNQGAAENWYVQAYSVVRFLTRERSRIQFKAFCATLRDGRPLKEALWLAFRYSSIDKFEKAWREWLGSHGTKRAAASAAPRESEERPSKGFQSMKGFKSLRD